MKPAPFLFALGLALGCSSAASAQDNAAPAAGSAVAAPAAVTLKLPDGGTYTGSVTNGVPDGKGYFKDANGMQYEGEVHMGQRTGVAEGLFPKGDHYQGQWKDGKPDGVGTMTYMLGGAYEGEWKNGRRHGKGTMTFAGSGRRAEVRFAGGRRVDVAAERPSRATAEARFSLNADNAPTGSNIKAKVAHSVLPLDKGFEQLTPEQQQLIRSYYPALEVGDDPPYPADGGKELYAALSKLAGRLQLREDVTVYVTVDANANVQSVATIGNLDPEVKRAIGLAAGMLKYTPARCGGQPCPGVVPFNMKLSYSMM